MESNKITSRQMILLITVFRLTTAILFMPSLNFPPYNQDVWISIILSFFYTVLIDIPILFLVNKFKDLSMIEYMEKILGEIIGKVIGIFYGLYFLLNATFLVTVETKIVTVNILAQTPNWLIIVILIITSLYIGSKGFHIVAWSGELIIPIIMISIIGLTILGLQNVDFTTLLPILVDSTFYDINLGALMLSLISTDVFILAMGAKYLENKKDINKIFLKSKIYSTILVAIIVIVTICALGVEQARHLNFPFLIYVRLINYEAVFERIDPIYTISWLASNIGRVVTYIYFSSVAFKKAFRRENNKIIIHIVGIIVLLISWYISNTLSIVAYGKIVNLYLILSAATFEVTIPLIALIVYFFRRKSLNNDIKTQNN